MVTKAVSDQFGKGGIADQMIRFNGFPFLDKEDHQFNEPGESRSHTQVLHRLIVPRLIWEVSHVMKRNVLAIPAVGLRLQELGETCSSQNFATGLTRLTWQRVALLHQTSVASRSFRVGVMPLCSDTSPDPIYVELSVRRM